MTLTESEKRILRAALREFSASAESDFESLREYHLFLREQDQDVSVEELAQKLEVSLHD
jgi:hypothetical protein